MPALTPQQVASIKQFYGEAPFNPPNPAGLYVQAPAEFGGGFWRVDPFTGRTPWNRDKPAAKVLPPGFEEIFGPEPGVGQDGRERWLTDLKQFKQAGLPVWFDADRAKKAKEIFEAWGLGEPRYYEGLYGWMVRFPFQKHDPDWEDNAWMAFSNAHYVVGRFQLDLINKQGIIPEPLSPLVPPVFVGGENPPQ